MIGYKIVEQVQDTEEYIPVYFGRGDVTYVLGETIMTLDTKGFYSYLNKELAIEELSNVVHDNIKSLKDVGCDIVSIEEYAKAYVVLECEFPNESVIALEGQTIRTITIKPLKQVGGLNL